MQMSSRTYLAMMVCVLTVALTLRVGVTWCFVGLDAPPDFEANPDQIDYELYARQMSLGKGYSELSGQPGIRRPPGTSFALYPVYKLWGRSFTAGRLWFCTLSALTCVVAGWVAGRCFSPLVGLTTAIWLALYPGHFYHAMHFVSETPYGFWLALALGLTVEAVVTHKMRFGWLAGLFWGLAVLTRPQVALALPVALVMVLARSRTAGRSFMGLWVVHACVVAAVLAPWLVRNTVLLGKPTISTVGGHTFWGANNEVVLNDPRLTGTWVKTSGLRGGEHPLHGTEIEMETATWRYGLQFIRDHAEHLPYLCAMKLYRLAWPFTTTPNKAVRWAFAVAWMIVVPFLLIGCLTAWRRVPGPTAVLFLPILATVVTAVIFYGSDRFRDSCAPAFLAFSSLGLIRIVSVWCPKLALVDTACASRSQTGPIRHTDDRGVAPDLTTTPVTGQHGFG